MTIGIDAIRQREQAATKGPWEAAVDDHGRGPVDASVWSDELSYYIAEKISSSPNHVADAEFIAHARTDVPALLDIAEAAKYEHGAGPCMDGECEHAHEDDENAPEDAPCPLVEVRYATAGDVIERDALLAKVDELTAELTRVNAAFKDAVAELSERYAERDAALNRAHRAETDAAQIARAKDENAAERDAMRPVVEAAKEWRDSDHLQLFGVDEAGEALVAAVDALPKAATV